MPTANEIRQQFIDFFVQKHGHTFVPSSSVVPLDDPTLLFTNAGMNQFKPYFLGTEKPPYPRAANTQKCIRAGGKHNDLDDVGKDTYHHTFFEMLGNWSFGDYFKKEAIAWAWELLTDVWKLDKARLHVTVFEGDKDANIPRDDEAAGFWRAVGVADDHIHLGNKKDNFWEMGDTGPCGPCTEIHYDNTPDLTGGKLVNKGTPDVIEIWNLVFIQFNRNADKTLTPLPAQHVDTGMGFERVTKVLQGKDSNYDTDVFTPLLGAIHRLTDGPKYGATLEDTRDIAYRVIADHARMATFAITDGARPGSKDRDSVLRSVIRRAVRFGYKEFGIREPFLFRLVHIIVDQMGDAFPELRRDRRKTEEIIEAEERDFLRTIGKGIELFARAVETITRLSKDFDAWRPENASKILPLMEELWLANSNSPIELAISEDAQNEKYYAARAFNRMVLFKKKTGLEIDAESMARWHQEPSRIPGELIFYFHSTLGFPWDLFQVMACEEGLSIDLDWFKTLQKRHTEVSRPQEATGHAVGTSVAVAEGRAHITGLVESIPADAYWRYEVSRLPKTDDSLKFRTRSAEGNIIAWVTGDVTGIQGVLKTGSKFGLVLNQTNFYAEQGGQVGDAGWIRTDTGTFEVEDTQRLGNSVIHWGKVWEGTVKTGQKATLEVAPARLDIMRNHTATHLLNWALREVLGEHVDQKGSLVDAEKTRFDFTHDKPMTHEEIVEVERRVNDMILADQTVTPTIMPLAEAKKLPGVRAVFGEKYPDPVRVVTIAPFSRDPQGSAGGTSSIEFCGGTHLDRTATICLFKIVSQEGVAKGVRRITAVTGPKAVEYDRQLSTVVGDLAERFKCRPEELPSRVESLQDEIKKLQQQLKKGASSDLAGTMDKLLSSATKIGDVTLLVGEIPAGPDDAIRTQVDRIKQKAGSAVVVVGWVDEGKVGLLAAVSDDVIKKGVKAGDLIKQIAPIVGGGGGGRPNMAQAGGKEPGKLGEALAQARSVIEKQLTK